LSDPTRRLSYLQASLYHDYENLKKGLEKLLRAAGSLKTFIWSYELARFSHGRLVWFLWQACEDLGEERFHPAKPRCVIGKPCFYPIKPCFYSVQSCFYPIKPCFYSVQSCFYPIKPCFYSVKPCCMIGKLCFNRIEAFVCLIGVLLQKIEVGIGCLEMDIQSSTNAVKALVHFFMHHSDSPNSVFGQGFGNGVLHNEVLVTVGCFCLKLGKVLLDG
jgi:hypothetical protein